MPGPGRLLLIPNMMFDAYQSYVPVATEINASYTAGAEAEVTEYAYRDINLNSDIVGVDTDAEVKAYLKDKDNAAAKVIAENYVEYEKVQLNKGTFYVNFDNLTDASVWDKDTNKSVASIQVIDTSGSSTAYSLSGFMKGTPVVGDGYTYSLLTGDTTPYASVVALLEAHKTGETKMVMVADSTTDNADIYEGNTDAFKAAMKADTIDEYFTKYVVRYPKTISEAVETDGKLFVTHKKLLTQQEIGYSMWNFNSDLTGEVSVDPYKVTTYFNNAGKMVVERKWLLPFMLTTSCSPIMLQVRLPLLQMLGTTALKLQLPMLSFPLMMTMATWF